MTGKWGAVLVCPPVGPHPVEVVDLDLFTAVTPVEVLVGPERRRALQFLFSQIELIGTERPLVAIASNQAMRLKGRGNWLHSIDIDLHDHLPDLSRLRKRARQDARSPHFRTMAARARPGTARAGSG